MLTPYLAGISPAEMGIPHGAMIGKINIQKMRSEDPNVRQPLENQNDFPSFEDTFKSAKKQDNKNGTPMSNQRPPQMQQQTLQQQFQQQQHLQQQMSFNLDDQPVGPARNNMGGGPIMQPDAFPGNFQINEPIHNDGQHMNPEEEKPLKREELMEREEPQVETHVQQLPIDPNVVNVDEILIKPKEKLTFEELLEKELKEKDGKTTALPLDDDRVIRKKPKKEFLKRTKKSALPKGKHPLSNILAI